MSTIDFDELLAPISEENVSGKDVSFEAIYDEIKEARRADADYLSQGDWKTNIKVAEWKKVKQLTCEVLKKHSKDLQITCWLIEALTHLHGLAGAGDGLLLLQQLLEKFWDTLYPEKEENDIELRVGRITWLDTNLPIALNECPLTAPTGEVKGYGRRRWQESRDVDNLARQSEQALQEALDEGKINSERWELTYKQTPAVFYETLLVDMNAAQQAFNALHETIEKLFVLDTPNINGLRETLSQMGKLIARLAADKGIGQMQNEAGESDVGGEPEAVVSQLRQGAVTSRADALNRLNDVAEYFRLAEPHSPVAYLLDKARRWGNMRLDEWLREVVQDSGTRDRLRDHLGYSEE